jgi:hypothetical protein
MERDGWREGRPRGRERGERRTIVEEDGRTDLLGGQETARGSSYRLCATSRTMRRMVGMRVRGWALALSIALAACSSPPPPAVTPAPERAVGLRVYVDPRIDARGGGSRLDGSGATPVAVDSAEGHAAAAFRKVVEGDLARAGFEIVADPKAPHDLTATLLVEILVGDVSRAEITLKDNGRLVDRSAFVGKGNSCTWGGRVTCLAKNASALLVNELVGSARLAHWANARGGAQDMPPAAVAKAPATSPAPGAGAASTPAQAPSPAPAPSAAPDASTFVVAAPQPSSYALIVGVEKYRDLPAPTGARGDAERMARLFTQTFGLREDHVRVALDDRATRLDIEKHLEWLRDTVPAGGRAYFYFSGHGSPDAAKGTPYIVPYDGDPRMISRTGIEVSEIVAQLSGSKAKETLVMLDSCFSGAGGRSVLPPGARPLVRTKEPNVKGHIAMFTAAGADEISGPVPGGAQGLFTKYVLDALGSGAADTNGDGQISLAELSAWVKPRVVRDAHKDNRSQSPTVTLGAGVGDADGFVVGYGYANH